MDQQLTITGSLGREPELRFIASGKAVCSFSVASSRRWLNKQTDEWQEKTTWFNVTAWDKLGENCAESLIKGARVVVTGRLEEETYEAKDGTERRVMKLIADEVGVSLRWATAVVTRTERTTGGYDNQDRPAARPTSNRQPANDAPQYGDEEPF